MGHNLDVFDGLVVPSLTDRHTDAQKESWTDRQTDGGTPPLIETVARD